MQIEIPQNAEDTKPIGMAKYRVIHVIPINVYVEIDAESEQDALEKSYDYIELSNFSGNDAISGKKIGTTHSNVKLQIWDVSMEDIDDDYAPDVELLNEYK